METLLSIIEIALAAVFAAAGTFKLTHSRQALAAVSGMGWTADASDEEVKAIGAVEVLAALGLVLPTALGILPGLTTAAAFGVVVLMLGAIRTHARRGELDRLPLNVVLAAMALFVAVTSLG